MIFNKLQDDGRVAKYQMTGLWNTHEPTWQNVLMFPVHNLSGRYRLYIGGFMKAAYGDGELMWSFGPPASQSQWLTCGEALEFSHHWDQEFDYTCDRTGILQGRVNKSKGAGIMRVEPHLSVYDVTFVAINLNPVGSGAQVRHEPPPPRLRNIIV